MNRHEPSFRDNVIQYVKEKYNIEFEYQWQKTPNYCVARRQENQKWFALIMDIPYYKLKIRKLEIVDVLNVKVNDPLLKDMLLERYGIFDGYHIAKGNWITILLDGTIELNQIFALIDESYNLTYVTKPKKKKYTGIF